MNTIDHRYDFVLLFDVQDGNPNGDPDAGNMPRFDPETGQGLVTDVCLKRKVRNFVGDREGTADLYTRGLRSQPRPQAGARRERRRDEEGRQSNEDQPRRKAGTRCAELMCSKYYDVRTFGAVMSTELDVGQVRGPVQLTFSRSIEPVFARDIAITRMAVTNETRHRQGADNRSQAHRGLRTLPRPWVRFGQPSPRRPSSRRRISGCSGKLC